MVDRFDEARNGPVMTFNEGIQVSFKDCGM